MQMLAGSDISEEAFSHHPILGTGLPGGSPVILCSSSTWTGVARHPGWGTHGCSPWAIKLHPPQPLLNPKSLCIYRNPTLHVQPDPAGVPAALVAWKAVMTPCPSHHLAQSLHHHRGCQCLPARRMLPIVWADVPHRRPQVSAFVSLHFAEEVPEQDSSEQQRGHRALLA